MEKAGPIQQFRRGFGVNLRRAGRTIILLMAIAVVVAVAVPLILAAAAFAGALVVAVAVLLSFALIVGTFAQ